MNIKNENQVILLDYIKNNPGCSSRDIFDGVELSKSYATVKRVLSGLVAESLVTIEGQGRGTKYRISPFYEVFRPIDVNDYYQSEIDERLIRDSFNISLISGILKECSLFTDEENSLLLALQKKYAENTKELSTFEYNAELERLAIDLSWKSSQIEGNTYSLLETERLLKEKERAVGKTREEAVMLLNHKAALDFIIETPDYLHPMSVSKIEDIHSILIKDLGVDRNIRKRRVGITGTNYRPIDNEFQIREFLQEMCDLINAKDSVFEKSLLVLLLISYIQPFVDGNKRTARIVSNAVLINSRYCPVSFRTVDSVEYKKAMLIFYEQNNITAFKEIFINQFEFAVKSYF